MNDHEKTKSQLIDELAGLRRQLKSSEVGQKRLEKQLEHILDHAPVLITVAGLNGYFKQVSPAFARILGYTEEDLLSKSAFEIIHHDRLPAGGSWRSCNGSSHRFFSNQ